MGRPRGRKAKPLSSQEDGRQSPERMAAEKDSTLLFFSHSIRAVSWVLVSQACWRKTSEKEGTQYYPSRLPSFLGFAVRPLLGCLIGFASVLFVSPLRGYAAPAQPPGSRRERPTMSQFSRKAALAFNREEASAKMLTLARNVRQPKLLQVWVQNLLLA